MKPFDNKTLLVSLSHVMLAAVAALYGIVIPRRFSHNPVDCDAFFIAYAFYSMVAMFSISMRYSVVNCLASVKSPGDEDSERQYNDLFWVVLGLFCGISLAVAVFSGMVGNGLASGLSAEGRHTTSIMLVLFAPLILIQGVAFFFSGALTARGGINTVSVVISIASLTGGLVFLLARRMGIYSSVLGLLVFNLVWIAGSWISLRHAGLTATPRRFHLLSFAGVKNHLWMIFSGAVPFVALNGASIVSQAITTHCAAGTPTTFSYAFLIISVAISVTAGSIGMSIMRQLTMALMEDRGRFRENLVLTVSVSGVVTSGILGLCTVLALPGGNLIFGGFASPLDTTSGNDFVSVFSRSVWILSVGGWALIIFSVMAPVVVAIGLSRAFITSICLILLLHLALGLLLLHYLGITGVSVGLSTTYVVLSVYLALWVSNRLGGRLTASLMLHALPSGLSAAATGCGVIYAMSVFHWQLSLWSGMVGGIAFAVIYSLVIWITQRKAVSALLARMRA